MIWSHLLHILLFIKLFTTILLLIFPPKKKKTPWPPPHYLSQLICYCLCCFHDHNVKAQWVTSHWFFYLRHNYFTVVHLPNVFLLSLVYHMMLVCLNSWCLLKVWPTCHMTRRSCPPLSVHHLQDAAPEKSMSDQLTRSNQKKGHDQLNSVVSIDHFHSS